MLVAAGPWPSHPHVEKTAKGPGSSEGSAAACRNVTTYMYIDLHAAARHSCFSEWTEDKDMREDGYQYCTALLSGKISCLRRRGNPTSAEPGGWQHTPNEESVCLRPGSSVGREKQTPFLSAVIQKKTPTTVIQQLTHLSHMVAVWKSN